MPKETPTVILASASPRRHQILTDAGIPHKIRPSDADESLPEGLTPGEAVMLLARRKAEAAVAASPNGDSDQVREVIVAADTLVWAAGRIFGKPRDREDAFSMISTFTGDRHSVFTGVCVTDGKRFDTRFEESVVYMRPASPKEIYSYIDRYAPYDKAGAYGIQEAAGLFVSRIEGDFQNIVGLPLCLTGIMLDSFGVELF